MSDGNPTSVLPGLHTSQSLASTLLRPSYILQQASRSPASAPAVSAQAIPPPAAAAAKATFSGPMGVLALCAAVECDREYSAKGREADERKGAKRMEGREREEVRLSTLTVVLLLGWQILFAALVYGSALTSTLYSSVHSLGRSSWPYDYLYCTQL